MSTLEEFLGFGELSTTELYRKVFAEFMGTFMFLYLGISSTIGWAAPAETMDVALVMGLALAASIATVGHISGGDNNPAVTIGFLLTRSTTLVRALLYILAQVAASALATCLIKCSLPKDGVKFGLTKPTVAIMKAFLVEVLITFVFVLVVRACADPDRPETKPHHYYTIGFSAIVCNGGGMAFSGAGMNPARSFGPALVMEDFEHHWIYWAGPILGGLAASVVYNLFLRPNATAEE